MSTKAAHVLIVDDEKNLCRILSKILMEQGYHVSVASSAPEAVKVFSNESIDAILTDVRMPGMDGMELLEHVRKVDPDIAVIVMTAYPSIEGAVRAMNAGAYNYIQKPFNSDEVLLTLDRALERRTLVERNRFLSEQLESQYGLENLIGKSAPMESVKEIIRKVAPTQSTVLITGQSGTGKEMVARAIHHLSERRKGNFVAINCGALPRDLLESELFGYEKGAFTDARKMKKGLVEVAAGGSLFLDEIGDMPLDLQTKLLRTIETGEFRRLGNTQNRRVDIRILAATNKDMAREIKRERFREDLFYRLNTLNIHISPLRDRREDIPELVEHFIIEQNKILRRRTAGVSKQAMKGMMRYDWPGNVRELQKCIERAMILNDGPILEFKDFGLPEGIVSDRDAKEQTMDQWDESTALPYRNAKEVFERQYFENLLRLNENNVSRSALAAGISRRHLQEKLKQMNIGSGALQKQDEEFSDD